MKNATQLFRGGRKFLISALLLLFTSISVFAQNVKPYTVDLNSLSAVSDDKTLSFNKATKTFTVTANSNLEYGGSKSLYLWLNSLDISSYNIVRVKYSVPNEEDYGFILTTDYDDDTLDWNKDKSTYCPSFLNEMVIPIKSGQKRLNGFCISATWGVSSGKFVIESITLEKDANSKPTDILANDEPPVIDAAANGSFDDSLVAWDFVKKLGVGLQYEALFNSILEADCEIDFGTEYTCVLNRPKPSKKEMHFIKEKGFKTLRVQFNPNPHMLDENYTIDPRFMRNLKQVVDFAIEEGMYVIVCGPANDFMSEEAWVEKVANDIHFAGYTISQESKKESKAFIQAVWKQIAAALNNSYDEHLIFETLNEPTDRFHEHTFQEKTDCAVCKKDFALLNEYNQMIVDTIRASGGNNAKRFIMVEGLGGGVANITTNLFKLPKDKVKNRLIPSVHNYPMGVSPWNKTYYTESIKKNNITDCFKALDKAYFSKKIPVYFSETGHPNKATPIMEAINCMKDFMAEVSNPKRSCAVVLHDSHNSETFYLYDKWELQWFDTEYIDTVIYGAEGKEFPLSEDFLKKNEVKVESIVGKNLLEAPVEIRGEDGGAGIKGDVFVRSRPENYKLEFEVEKLSSKATIYLAYNDYKGNWNEVMTKSKVKLLKGGNLDGAMIKVKDNTVVVSIDNATSCEFETGGELYILGEDIILKSVKVME